MLASLLRLGFLAQLLSRPVTQGFLTGSAILIVASQAHHVFGVERLAELPDFFRHLLAGQLSPTAQLGIACLLAMAFNRYALAALLARLGVPERTAGFAVG